MRKKRRRRRETKREQSKCGVRKEERGEVYKSSLALTRRLKIHTVQRSQQQNNWRSTKETATSNGSPAVYSLKPVGLGGGAVALLMLTKTSLQYFSLSVNLEIIFVSAGRSAAGLKDRAISSDKDHRVSS